jgi:hypothetical protein
MPATTASLRTLEGPNSCPRGQSLQEVATARTGYSAIVALDAKIRIEFTGLGALLRFPNRRKKPSLS